MAVSSNRVPLSGLARRLVADGLLEEEAAGQAFQDALAKKVPFVRFLVENGIIKGAMNLIDADRAELLYSRMGPAIEASGGSAGNTAAGVASFGGKGAYIGKVRNDQLGAVFGHDLKATGVSFETASATSGQVLGGCSGFRPAALKASLL